jgi:hypothetical protein
MPSVKVALAVMRALVIYRDQCRMLGRAADAKATTSAVQAARWFSILPRLSIR